MRLSRFNQTSCRLFLWKDDMIIYFAVMCILIQSDIVQWKIIWMLHYKTKNTDIKVSKDVQFWVIDFIWILQAHDDWIDIALNNMPTLHMQIYQASHRIQNTVVPRPMIHVDYFWKNQNSVCYHLHHTDKLQHVMLWSHRNNDMY